MPTQIVLLRGVNLGRSRRVQMAPLREALSQLGYERVRTHLQSGNVLLDSAKRPATLERQLEQQLAAYLGFAVDVFVRSRDELADVLARNPLRAVASDPTRYLVTFLRRPATAAVRRRLEALELEPERLAVIGREIYSWHPGGVGRSALREQLTDRNLGGTATGRNWSTVTRLVELADA